MHTLIYTLCESGLEFKDGRGKKKTMQKNSGGDKRNRQDRERQVDGEGMQCESGNKCLALCVPMYCSRSRRRRAFMARD